MGNEHAVIAVVVTYNRKMLLQESMNALLAQDQKNFDIMVIDNASIDGTNYLMNQYATNLQGGRSKIIYHRLDHNIGGAGGFQLGVMKAVKLGYQYIWMMDDDTVPKQDSLAKLCETVDFIHGKFGYLSSAAVWTDGTLCTMNAQKLKERLTKKEYCDVQKGIIPIQSATFVSLFLNSDAVKKAGLPLKEYFIWGDDKEYTLRISKQYPCYLVSSSVVTHKMNSNNGSNLITDDKVRIGRYRYAYRNDLATAKKNGGKEILSYYFYFFKTMIHIIRFSPSYKLLRLFTLFRGMLEGIAFYPKTEFMQNER